MKNKDDAQINNGLLLVGNYDSNEGYAWKLIEGFWIAIATEMAHKFNCVVVFPTVSAVSQELQLSPVSIEEYKFGARGFLGLIRDMQYILKNRIKILYLTDQKTSSIKYIAYRLSGVKSIVVHDHKPGVRPQLTGLKKIVKQILFGFPGVRCDYAFAVSPYIKTRLMEVDCVPESKIITITNGIKINNSIEISKEKNNQKVKIVTVCRMTKYKGIDFALRVFSKVLQKNPSIDAEYIVVGDGPDLAYFQELALELKIDSRVNFLGKQTGVPEIINNCDIAFHPSYGEALSLAMLEYMSLGLPILCSDNPSVSSILTDDVNAVIYREYEEADAATKLSRLMLDAALRQGVGDAARRLVISDFQIERTLTDLKAAAVKVWSAVV